MSDELPEGWAVRPLSEIFLLNPPKPPADLVPPSTPVSFVPMPAVDSALGSIQGATDRPFSDVRKGYTAFADNDVILAKITPCFENGKAAVARGLTNGMGFGSSEFFVFRGVGTVIPQYLFHFVRQQKFRDEGAAQMNGAVGQARVPADFLRSVKLPISPLPEQHRIVEKVEALLEQVNRAKERLDRVPLILKRFRQAVLAAACSGELTREWRQNHKFERSAPALVEDIWEQRARSSQRSATLGPPATEAVKNLDGWCETRIGDVVDCLDNIRRPINKDERANRTGNIPYFGANGQVGWIDSYLFDEDLVLVVEDETFVGREKPFSYVVRGKTWVNNHAHVLRPLGGMSAEYLDTCLAFYNFVPLTSGTTGRRKLTKAALLSAPICVAPLAEQQEIVRLTTALFSLADTIERRVQAAATRANKLPQAILSKAFSGELVPTEAELARLEGRTYETAEELLKRVTALGSDAPVAGKGRGRRARKAE